MKQVIVTFNFDPETEMVSDVKCTVDGIEKKKKTTKKAVKKSATKKATKKVAKKTTKKVTEKVA